MQLSTQFKTHRMQFTWLKETTARTSRKLSPFIGDELLNLGAETYLKTKEHYNFED